MGLESNDVVWDDQSEGEQMGTFVWERDATKRMVKNAEKPSAKQVPKALLGKPVMPNYFVEFGDGVDPVDGKKVDLDADLYSDPDFLAVSGHFDSDVIEDVAAEAEMVDGMTVDPVANVARSLNERIGVNTFLDVVSGSDAVGEVNDVSAGDLEFPDREPTVAVPRGEYKLLLAMAERDVGVSRNGRVDGRGGRVKGATVVNKNIGGTAASM